MKRWAYLFIKCIAIAFCSMIFLESAHYAIFGKFASGEAANGLSTLSMAAGLYYYFRTHGKERKKNGEGK